MSEQTQATAAPAPAAAATTDGAPSADVVELPNGQKVTRAELGKEFVALTKQRQKLAEREAALKASEAEIAALREAKDALAKDPVAAMKKLAEHGGHKFEDVWEKAARARLAGDATVVEDRIAQLEAQIAEREKREKEMQERVAREAASRAKQTTALELADKMLADTTDDTAAVRAGKFAREQIAQAVIALAERGEWTAPDGTARKLESAEDIMRAIEESARAERARWTSPAEGATGVESSAATKPRSGGGSPNPESAKKAAVTPAKAGERSSAKAPYPGRAQHLQQLLAKYGGR